MAKIDFFASKTLKRHHLGLDWMTSSYQAKNLGQMTLFHQKAKNFALRHESDTGCDPHIAGLTNQETKKIAPLYNKIRLIEIMIPRDHRPHHAVDVVSHGVVVDDVVNLRTSFESKSLIRLTSWMGCM